MVRVLDLGCERSGVGGDGFGFLVGGDDCVGWDWVRLEVRLWCGNWEVYVVMKK